jgi:hypothetical protein
LENILTNHDELDRIWSVKGICVLIALSLMIYTACSSTEAVNALPAPQPVVTPVESIAADEPGQAEEFVVTEEIFTKTFDEIETFINNLNEIIHSKDYETWISYLSEDYIRRTSDETFLKAQSETPVLQKHNIKLENLRDYFEYVVVPSRSRTQLDDIEIIDEEHVKAISVVNDTRGLLYLLVRENDSWFIGVW